MTGERVTEFVGVSSEPRRGVMPGTGPYEFLTDSGVPVFLHDADFLGLLWQPTETLRFYFAYDPAWTPAAAKETPVIELTFSGAQVLRWEVDRDAVQEDDMRGLVRDLAWDGRNRFDLATTSLDLSFTADRMVVRLLPSAPSAVVQ